MRRPATVPILILALAQIATARDIYVSPSGNAETGRGTSSRPYATLKQAIEHGRRIRPEERRIILQPGIHRLAKTLVLTREDNGLTITSADPDKPSKITSSTPLSGWEKSAISEHPIYELTLDDSFPHTRSLFFAGKPLPRARGQGFRQLDKAPAHVAYRDRFDVSLQRAYVPKAVFETISDFTGAELRLIPRYPWVCHLQPIAEANPKNQSLFSNVPGTYPMTTPAFGHFPEGTMWIENTIDVLDSPGEWCFNPKTRKLSVWPPDGKAPDSRIEIPRLTELMRIEGEAAEFRLEDKPATDIVIRDLIFTGGNAYAWEETKAGLGLQHDWELYDRPTAMLRLRGAARCRIEDCRFINSGTAGIRLDLDCRRNVVQHCEFAHLGGTGVLLAGYGPGFKDVNRGNTIAHNNIHHIGEVWWHSPGIFAWQSGLNRIAHNHIHHTPYIGIVVSTRVQFDMAGKKEASRTARMDEVQSFLEGKERTWKNREPLLHGRFNDVGWNDIHHVMEKLADGNAIYVSGTGAGNRIHHNHIHDIESPNINATIRIDDDQHEVTIDHNLITRTTGEGLLWKGRCDIFQNIIHALRVKTPDGTPVGHQRGFIVLSSGDVRGSTLERNLFISKNPRYPILYERETEWKLAGRTRPAVRLDHVKSNRNLYWNEANPNWADDFFATQRARGVETESVFADPGFTNEQGLFDEPIGSVHEPTGFVRFNLDEAGPAARMDSATARQSIRHLKAFVDLSRIEAVGKVQLQALGQLGATVEEVNLERSRPDSELFATLLMLPNLEWLNLWSAIVSDDDLRWIGQIKSLTDLPIGNTGITDEGLPHLAGLTKLKYLGLRRTKISATGLEVTKELPVLRELNLTETACGDAATVWMSRHLPKLRVLWMADTPLTNEGLKNLATMTSLETLYIQRTKTTVDAVKELRAALPDCEIYWESDPK